MLEDPNTASSDGPFGMEGDQLVPGLLLKFQFPLKGVVSHVATTPALLRAEVRSNNAAAATKKWRKGEYREMPMIRRGLVVWGFIVF